MNRIEIAYLLGWPNPPKDSDLLDRVESVVKRAVLAERDSCAVLVENYTGAWDDQGYALAQAIRARGQE